MLLRPSNRSHHLATAWSKQRLFKKVDIDSSGMERAAHGAETITAVQTRKGQRRGSWFTIVPLLDSYGRFIPKSEGKNFAKVRRRMKNILPWDWKPCIF